jgi:MarR family transcriptional regulator, organic hydroperoxide resistance regulator
MDESHPIDRSEIEITDWQLLAQVSHVYRNVIEVFFNQIDMHRAQVMLLNQLYNQDGVTQSEIAYQLALHGATVTDQLQRMEEAALITRQRDTKDRRLVRVYLTDSGREKERCLKQQFDDIEAAIFANISPENRFLLRGMLKQIHHNMSSKLLQKQLLSADKHCKR